VTTRRKIGIDCLFADPTTTFGTWVFANNLLDKITQADPDTDYILFVNRKVSGDLKFSRPNLRVVIFRWAGMSTVLRLLYQNIVLPLYARWKGLSLLHSLGNYGPVIPFVPSVVTVHDVLATFDAENAGDFRFRLRSSLIEFLTKRSLRQARAISAVSEFTRQKITAKYPFCSVKIRVIYNGLPAGRTGTPPDHESVLRKYKVIPPYVLAVGLFPPHKNIGRLIEAFAKLKCEAGVPHSLVLVGKPRRIYRKLCRIVASQGLGSHVTFTGPVSDEELPCLYQQADLFVYPSLMEGFGLPPLEAMANGIPVACSSAGPLPEVVGDAAVFFNPVDIQDMERAIREALESSKLRARLVTQGLKQVERFSFCRTAEETLKLYREAISAGTNTVASV
jgi:glycosyltransferase involved in cell wall biosynthesis